MEFRFKGFKGYVKAENGKITCHDADPGCKYMQKLVEKAENWVDAWQEADKPDYDFLSEKAKQQVDRKKEGYALKRFTERVKRWIIRGDDHDKIIRLWFAWLGEDATMEAAQYLYEQHLYSILKEEE